MTEMQAVVVGENDELELMTVPRPLPLAGEVLIRAAAIGVNPIDWKTRISASSVRKRFDPSRPVILGWDVAGTVVDVGFGVDGFSVGDRVFAMPRFPQPAEAYAEYVVADFRDVAGTPDGVSDVDAAAVPLAGLTAWQALVGVIGVGEGDRVLIHAASGGVGHLAVQIAKAHGAEVWATASASKHEFVRGLGADHVVDHHLDHFEDEIRDMDAVLDLYAGAGSPTRLVATLGPGGRMVLVSPANMPADDVLVAAEVTAQSILVEPDGASLTKLADMMAGGALKVAISESRPLSAVAELHEIIRDGVAFGKLVATVQ